MRAELALFGVASRPPSYRANKQDALTHARFHFDRLDGGEPFWLLDVQLARLEALLRWRAHGAPFGSGFGLGAFARFARAREPEPYAALYAGLLLDYGWHP
jgi:hypothetical protein